MSESTDVVAPSSTLIGQRYRDPGLPELTRSTATIDMLLAHRSVRAFVDEPVDDDILTAIVAAAQSASTSSNLQVWSVIAVRDPYHKDRVATLAGDQDFIRAAPIFLVWVADLSRARRLALRNDVTLEATEYLESTVLGFVDAALAAQNAVVAAESFGLGTVYVGAIRNRPLEVAAELGLPDGVVATFGLALGWPDPAENAGIKPRLPQSVVVHHERYEAEPASAIDDYDRRLADYNAEHGRSAGWVTPVIARLRDRSSLKGRHALLEQLRQRGLPTR